MAPPSTVTLNIPASTPLSAVKIPGLNLGPLLSIKEITNTSTVQSGGGCSRLPPSTSADSGAVQTPPRRRPPRPTTRCWASSRPNKTKKKAKPSVKSARLRLRLPLQSTQLPERARPTKTRLRHSNGVPDPCEPDALAGDPGASAGRRSQLLHQEVPRSRRSCSRSTRPPVSSTASAGRSWRRSTRSRPTTAATSTSPRPAPWAGCSSSHPAGRAGASTPTRTARPIRTTWWTRLRGGALPARSGRRPGSAQGDLRLQPRRLVRRLRRRCGRASSAACRLT